MLMMMLDAHPELGVSRESWFLIELMDALPLRGSLSTGQVRRAMRIISGHPRWQRWKIADERLEEALSALESPTLAELIEATFQLDLARSQKPRWGDKTPAYVGEISRLHELFPGAKFVHLVRDARDVCISLRKVGWHGPKLADMARYWRRQVSLGVESGRLLRGELYLQIAYEDLVHDTEGTLRRVVAFLGETFEPRLLVWHELTAEKTKDRPMRFQTKLDRAPRPSDVHRWKRELSALEIIAVEAAAGDVMQNVGQELRFPVTARAVHAFDRVGRLPGSVMRRVRRIAGSVP